jgi:hypothetical protein
MDFVSQEHGVPHDGPKDSNTGDYTREILDRNETWRQKHGVPLKGGFPENVNMEHELHGARFSKLQKIQNLNFEKIQKKIPECSL